MEKNPKWVDAAYELFMPYMEQGPKGPRLKKDSPPEVVEAYKKVREWAWNPERMQ